MYLYFSLIILIVSVSRVESKSSNSSDGKRCEGFVTQGTKDEKTVIRLNFPEDKINEINIDLNKHEWTVHVQTAESIGSNDCVNLKSNCLFQAWKSARILQTQLQQNHQVIGKSNQIENMVKFMGNYAEITIKNKFLEFGIEYNVELKTLRNNKVIYANCFTITRENSEDNNDIAGNSNSDNENLENRETTESNANTNPMELILIGPDRIFCNNILIINAYVVGNYTSDMTTFQWKLKETPGATPQILGYQGSRLELPENTLNFARTYEIICELMSDNQVITSDKLKVSVRKPKILIHFQSKNQTVGINQPIKIIAHIDIPKNIKHEIIWTCTHDNKPCGQFSSTKTLSIKKGFSEIGLYKFDLSVIQNDNTNETMSTFVEIKYFNRSIEFDEIPAWIKPSEKLDIVAYMKNIRSGCTLKWESVHNSTQEAISEGYQFFNISQTNYNRTTPVFVKRDAFLKELAPFSDIPGTQKVALKINQKLLQQEPQRDAKYLLKFTTNCLSLEIIFADIEIITNSAPVTNELKVSPSKGDALFTIFRFETIPAQDKAMDLPLTYYFGWYATQNSNVTQTNHEEQASINETIITYFSKTQEFYMAETVLPYIKESNGILTAIMKVCDNKESCSTVQGPKIEVKLSAPMSEESHSIFKAQISRDLLTNDFHKFTTDAAMIFQTYQALKNNFHSDLQMAVNQNLERKIKELLDRPNKNSIHHLISALTNTEHVFQASANVLKNVVKLRGRLVNEKMSSNIVTDDEREALGVINNINEKDLSTVTTSDIRKYFEATEFIITTSNDAELVNREKENFINNIDKYLGEVCAVLYRDHEKKNFKFSLQTAYIVLEKFSHMYFRNFKYVPSANYEWEENIQILLNQTWHMKVLQKPMCIGKAVVKDYLGHNGFLYYVKLFNNNMKEFKLEQMENTIMKRTSTPEKFKCSVYSDNAWQQCRRGPTAGGSSNLVCMCNKMGYFRISNSTESDVDLETADGNANNTTGSGSGGTGNGETPNSGTNANGGDNNGSNGSNNSGNGNSGGTGQTTPGSNSSGANNGTNGSGDTGNGGTADGNTNNSTESGSGGTGSTGNEGTSNSGTNNNGSDNNGSNGGNNSNGANNGDNNSNGSGGTGNGGTTTAPPSGSGSTPTNPGTGNSGGNTGINANGSDSGTNNGTNSGAGNSENNGGNGNTGNPNNSGDGTSSTGNNGNANNPGSNTGNTNNGSSNGDNANNPGGSNNTGNPEENPTNNQNGNNGSGSSNTPTPPTQNPGTGTPVGNAGNPNPSNGNGNTGDSENPPVNPSNNNENSGGSNSQTTPTPNSGGGGNDGATGNQPNSANGSNNANGNNGGSGNPPGNPSNTENGGNSGNNNGTGDINNAGTTAPSSGSTNGSSGPDNTNPGGNTGNNPGGNNASTNSGTTGSNSENNGGNGNTGNTNNSGNGNDTPTPPTASSGNVTPGGANENRTNPPENNSNNGTAPNPGPNEGNPQGTLNETNNSNGDNNNIGNGSTNPDNTSNSGNDNQNGGPSNNPESNGTSGSGTNNPGSPANPETGNQGGSNSNNGANNPGNSNDSNNSTNNNGSIDPDESVVDQSNNNDNITDIETDVEGTNTNAPTGSNNNTSDGDTDPTNSSGGNSSNASDNNNGDNSSTNPSNSNSNSNSNNGNGGTNQDNSNSSADSDTTIITTTTTTTTVPPPTTSATTSPTTTTTAAPPTTARSTLPPPTTTSQIVAAGPFMSLGDQISFAVIGLCVLGTSGLILFGIVSKRVRKVRAEETVNEQSEFPMYADIYQKENMHGEF